MPRDRRSSLVALLALPLVHGCHGDPTPAGQPAPPPPIVEAEVEPEYPTFEAIDPATVEPLDVLYLPRQEGPGYPRVPVDIGPSLVSAKRLDFTRNTASFLGPRHVLVEKSDKNELSATVLVDVETGAVTAEFARATRVQWDFGLALVFKAGDERPYLLDAATGALVLAVPTGEHGYQLGENYQLRLSPVGPYVWVYAQDEAGVHHLYAWDELGSPPELPNNPFPFRPEEWNPLHSTHRSDADTEEVTKAPRDDDECTRVLLEPPKGWRCLDELDIEDSQPISEGWRLDYTRNRVFNLDDGKGYDLSPLCSEDSLVAGIRYRSPPQLELRCYGEEDLWMLWTAPRNVRRLAPEHAKRLNKGLLMTWHEDIGRHVLTDFDDPSIVTFSDTNAKVERTVGDDYECPDLDYRTSRSSLSGVICMANGPRGGWAELQCDQRQQRTRRFDAIDLAVGRQEMAVAIVHRNGREHLVQVALRSN